MRRYNIVTKKIYQKNGEDKATWLNCGSLTYFPASGDKDEGYRLELNMFPNEKFYVFEQKPKEERNRRAEPAEEVDPDRITF